MLILEVKEETDDVHMKTVYKPDTMYHARVIVLVTSDMGRKPSFKVEAKYWVVVLVIGDKSDYFKNV